MLQTCRSRVKFRGMAASTLRQRSVMGNCVFSINSLGFAVQDAATSAVRFSFLRGEAGGTRMAAGDGMDPHPPKLWRSGVAQQA
jgi:hypothetical protein